MVSIEYYINNVESALNDLKRVVAAERIRNQEEKADIAINKKFEEIRL